MTFLGFLKRQSRREPSAERSQGDRGILIFENTSDVIRAESTLKAAGWTVRVMGPPPEIQRGCDLVIEFPLIEELNILRSLEEADAEPMEVVPVVSPLLRPVDLFQVKDFGGYLMVRAANMKLTVDTGTGLIVNISGGGCPDVPYLASRMVGKPLSEAPSPAAVGHTLCGYALQLAWEEMRRRCLPS